MIEAIYKIVNSKNGWSEPRNLNRDDFLCKEGDLNSSVYFIEKGAFRVFIVDEVKEHCIRFGYQNNIISALDSYLSDQPSKLYIQALRKSTVREISKNKLEDLLFDHPEGFNLWNNLSHQLILDQMEREQDLLTESPLSRYNRVAKRSPQLFQEIPSKYIANYLRMTPETLSRIKNS